MVNSGKEKYRIGSTYLWNNEDDSPNEVEKKLLMRKLADMTNLTFEVVSHQAAIRPTTSNREPILVRHPEYQNMIAFNGLGTKGVMRAPWWASNVVKLIQQNSLP